VARHLVRSLREQARVLHVTTNQEVLGHPDTVIYQTRLARSAKNLQAFLAGLAADVSQYDYVIMEFPSLLKQDAPMGLIADLDLVLVTCQANRVWSHADQHIWETINKTRNGEASLIVNGVRPETMEDFIGELPKRRSRLRRMIKEYLRLNFSGSSQFPA
jgi:cellulose biosynthesis protein BcsQ